VTAAQPGSNGPSGILPPAVDQELVVGVDHVFVPLADAERAFRFLSADIGLPVAWPYSSYGMFASGAVSLGNANLELLRSGDAAPWFRGEQPARVQGIAFEPVGRADEAFLAALDARGIRHTPAMPFEGDGPERARVVLWTNVMFLDFISDRAGAFACDYQIPGAPDRAERRRALEEVGGGPLGVVGLAEVVVGSADPAAAIRRWERLLGPLRADAAGVWRPAEGSALRVIESAAERVERLVLAVRSPERAASIWAERGGNAALEGLEVRFTAA
jgi:hypothetical protein